MTNKTIEEVVREFENFLTQIDPNTGVMRHNNIKSSVEFLYQALTSLHRTFLEERIEEVRGMKRDRVTGGFDGEREMNIEIATYNEALSDILLHDEKLLEELNKGV